MKNIIHYPEDRDILINSRKGDVLYYTGKLFTLRDAACIKLNKMLSSGVNIPVSFKNSVLYYMAPSPTRPGNIIGSCGPTSSYRMDAFLEMNIKLGTIATIGKGERSELAFNIIKQYKTPYFITVGGAAAYLADCVKSLKVVLFEELGPEAIREIAVENFPIINNIDIY